MNYRAWYHRCWLISYMTAEQVRFCAEAASYWISFIDILLGFSSSKCHCDTLGPVCNVNLSQNSHVKALCWIWLLAVAPHQTTNGFSLAYSFLRNCKITNHQVLDKSKDGKAYKAVWRWYSLVTHIIIWKIPNEMLNVILHETALNKNVVAKNWNCSLDIESVDSYVFELLVHSLPAIYDRKQVLSVPWKLELLCLSPMCVFLRRGMILAVQALQELDATRNWAALHVADNSCFHYRQVIIFCNS